MLNRYEHRWLQNQEQRRNLFHNICLWVTKTASKAQDKLPQIKLLIWIQQKKIRLHSCFQRFAVLLRKKQEHENSNYRFVRAHQ